MRVTADVSSLGQAKDALKDSLEKAWVDNASDLFPAPDGSTKPPNRKTADKPTEATK